MGKKILSAKIYPSNLDMKKRWFVQYWTKEDTPRRLKHNVPLLSGYEARLAAAQKIIENLKSGHYLPSVIEKQKLNSNDLIRKMTDLLENRKGSLSNKSFQTMYSHIKIFDVYCRDKKIKSVDFRIAENFLDDLMQRGKHPRTVNNYRTTFNALARRLLKRKEMRSNPFEETENQKGESDCPEWFKEHEAKALKKYMLENKPFLWFAARWEYYCLMRPGTISDLRIADVDFTRWRVKIRSVDIKNKTDKSYWVVIPKGLIREIEPLCLYQYPPNFYLVGHEGIPAADNVKTTNYWHYHFQKVLIACGFTVGDRRRSFYGWKHTGFAHAYLAGIGLIELMKQAGHANISQTYEYVRRLGLEDFPEIRDKYPTL
jgi:integrase